MKPALFLHIGDPKTGSTSIQQTLLERTFICETRSLDYPSSLSAYPLAKAMKDDAAPDLADHRFGHYVQWLAASDSDAAVISAEQFSTLPPEKVAQTFQTYFPQQAPTMTVVAYVRPHISRFLSAYAQRTKAGLMHRSLDEFYSAANGKALLNFYVRFSNWRAVFGDRFILRPMARDHLKDGDVVVDFLDIALSGAPFRLTGATEVNSSLSVEALAGLRLMHRVMQKFELGANVQHAVGSRLNTLIAQSPAKGTKLRISAALYDRMRSQCEDDAEALDAAFFDQPIMMRALDAAALETVPEPQDWDGRTMFPAETQQTLRKNTRRLVMSFQSNPGVWEGAYRHLKGHTDGQSAFVPNKAQIKVIEEVEDILSETVAILTAFSPLQIPDPIQGSTA